jgi:GNAT superfamily N-acetyltransferase
MGIIIAQKGNPDFETMKQRLLMRPSGGGTYALNTLCQKKIGDEFTTDAINNAHFLVINLNDRNEILGFAAVMYYLDDNNDKYLYIELICNAPGHSMGLRSSVNRAGAKAMIEQIEQLARNMGCSYVKLSAIDQVVPYYFRLGFNFKSVVGPDGEINTVLQERSAALVQNLRDGQLDDDKEAQEQAMIKIIQRFYPGYLNERYQETLSKVRRNPTGPAREQGIPMIKWLDTGRPQQPLQADLAPHTMPNLGGKRKTKKRRYKSKSKRNKRKSKARKQRKGKSKKSRKSKK